MTVTTMVNRNNEAWLVAQYAMGFSFAKLQGYVHGDLQSAVTT